MSRQTRTTYLLIAALGAGLSPLVMAWTPYGYDPYGPGYQGGYPETAPPPGTGGYGPELPPPAYPGGGYGGPWGYPQSTEAPQLPEGDTASDPAPPPPYPGYGPRIDPSWGYPSTRPPGFGRPPGFRLSRTTEEDAYILTIELDGMSPEEVQVSTQGNRILVSRERSEQQVQNESFEDGRGFMRSFSYSSGTASRRTSVPRDGDLSAMSREDSETSIRIRIPRLGR